MPKGYFRDFRSPQFLGTVMAKCMSSIVAYLGWVLPANTLMLINGDLGNSMAINWVATAWTLGSCIGFLIVGRMSDIFGRKWMVQSSIGTVSPRLHPRPSRQERRHAHGREPAERSCPDALL